MPEAADQIAILYQDLELFAHALQNAESQAAALDALLGIRDLQFKKSKLRNQLHRASMRANSLLASIEEDPGQ